VGLNLNENGCLLAKATHVGSDTTLSQIVRIVETAQLARAPAQKLADQISKFFVLIVSVLVSFEYLLYTFLSFPAINGYLQDNIVFLPSTIRLLLLHL
jgi:cation transport ATPase